MTTSLRPADISLAVLVVFVFGVSFVAVKLALAEVPPFALSAWRFFLAAFPLVLLTPRPRVAAWVLVGYGLSIGVLQFGLAFSAIALGMPAGITALVIQVQVFFTVGLSVWLYREHVGRAPLAGAVVAGIGLVVIGTSKISGGLGWPFLLVIASGLAWACGNIISKRAGRVEPFSFIAWTSLAAPAPLSLLSLAFERPGALWTPLVAPTWPLWVSLVALAYGATVFGFGLWARLLSSHPAAQIAPFALLIPVFGMASTAIVFDERLTLWQAVGVVFVIAGLALVVFGPRVERVLTGSARVTR
jgi:O-acetylserine/cysteine efflux transporter